MNQILRIIAAFVAGIILVETFVYLLNQWFMDHAYPPDDSPDKHS